MDSLFEFYYNVPKHLFKKIYEIQKLLETALE
jgi:hypothetical protein